MATSNKKQIVDSKYIISKYMDYVLEHGDYPKTVYKFCKEIKIKEQEFYNFFGSLDNLDKDIWTTLFIETVEVMRKSKEYDDFTSREKMLALFYSFFETLTLNRSYALFALNRYDMPLKSLKQLMGLRIQIKDFAAELIEADNEEKTHKFVKNPITVFSEGAWLQFLFLLNFWKNDESTRFEKTDVAIEKSVNTIFDLFDNTPLSNVIDFGKFLWNEKSNWN